MGQVWWDQEAAVSAVCVDCLLAVTAIRPSALSYSYLRVSEGRTSAISAHFTPPFRLSFRLRSSKLRVREKQKWKGPSSEGVSREAEAIEAGEKGQQNELR